MQPVTKDLIRDSFVNMTEAELNTMSFPGLHETLWAEREFLGWRDVNHNTRGYLVFWVGSTLRGIMVRAAETAMPSGRSALCVLCHTQQPAPQVSLFVAPKAGHAGARGNTVGTYVCADLACSTIIRMVPALPGGVANTDDRVLERGVGVLSRLENFSERVLSRDAD
jgi:hypothetical protein